MSEVSKENYVDPRYKKYMKSKPGRKIIALLRVLTQPFLTRKKLETTTGFSTSEVRKLLLKAIELGYVEEYRLKDRVRRWRRRRRLGDPSPREIGRRPCFYALTKEGLWLIRLDPQVRGHWKQVEITYKNVVESSAFNSYVNLKYGIQKHPSLKEYQKPYYFMDEELERILLNPFIYGGPLEGEEEKVYNELVKIIKGNVRSEHVANYYIALEDAVSEISRILARHKLLMKKMEVLPQVQKYLKKCMGRRDA